MKKQLILQSDLTLKEAFDKFQKANKLKNLSAPTIDYYQDGYSKFLKFNPDENLPLNQINSEFIKDYTGYLMGSTKSMISVNTYLRSFRTFLYWCADMGYLTRFKVSSIKSEKPIKQIYTDAELAILVKRPLVKKCTFAEYRNYVICCFLLGTGVRVASAVNIQIKDIDLNNEMIILKHTKNKKQQIIPISSSLSKVLIEYLGFRDGEPEDYLFCTSFGKQLSAVGFEQAIRYYSEAKGLSNCGAHKFRHTFAYHYIKNGGEVVRLQKILGHSSLQITQNYVNMFGLDLKDNLDKYNPLDAFMGRNKEKIKMK